MRHCLGFYQPATWVQLASSAKAIGPIRHGSLCLALPTRGLTCQHAIPHSKILSAARGRSPQKLQISLEGLEGGQPRCWLSGYAKSPDIVRQVWTMTRLKLGQRQKYWPSRSNIPLFPPGQAYDYCNTNYALLGLVAEKIEHKPLAGVFQTRLFGPLGMRQTLLPAGTSNTLPEPYAHGYLYGGPSYALADMPYPPDLRAAAKAGILKPNDDTNQNPSYASAVGGVISNADNLATWIRALGKR
jgi:hypothetical protein